MSDGDPHNRTSRIQNTVQNIQKSEKISESNKEFILDFKQFLHSQSLSKDRISRYLYSLKRIAEHIDWDMQNPDKSLIVELVGDINQSKLWDKEVSPHTQAEYRKSIRKWCEYLESVKKEFDSDKMTDFFSVYVKKKYKDPEQLPTPQTVAKIVRECSHIRGSAFCMSLWTSARVGAVLGLKYKDLRFHEDIAVVKFRDTKTGDDRKVPVASAFPYLKQHKENDPLGDNPEAFVFRPLNSTDPEEQLSYNGARGIIERAAEKADIPDIMDYAPHDWRRGRITDLARKGYGEAIISQISGHIIGSSEIRLYCRLASTDVERSIREEAGLETKDEDIREDPLRPKKCPNSSCNQLNKWQNQHCSSCGEILSTGELFKQVKTDETTAELRKNIVEEESKWNDEEIKDKARELVEEQLK